MARLQTAATIAESACADIKRALGKVEEAVQKINKAFDCEWDDCVKDSYRKYNKQCQSAKEELGEQVIKFQKACDSIQAIDVDDLIDDAETCCEDVRACCSGC